MKILSYACVCIIAGLTVLFGVEGYARNISGLGTGTKSDFQTLLSNQKADIIYSVSGWELKIYKFNKGTRSEGCHGVLYHDKEPVAGKIGEKRDIPIGIFIYVKDLEQRTALWDTSGWKMVKMKAASVMDESNSLLDNRPHHTNETELDEQLKPTDSKGN